MSEEIKVGSKTEESFKSAAVDISSVVYENGVFSDKSVDGLLDDLSSGIHFEGPLTSSDDPIPDEADQDLNDTQGYLNGPDSDDQAQKISDLETAMATLGDRFDQLESKLVTMMESVDAIKEALSQIGVTVSTRPKKRVQRGNAPSPPSPSYSVQHGIGDAHFTNTRSDSAPSKSSLQPYASIGLGL